MRRTPTIASLAFATVLSSAVLSLPARVEAAHGHHGGAYVGVGFGGFYGWGPYWGPWGWGAPYWGWGWGPGPYYYGAPGNGLLGYAMASGMGGVDVDVKPNRAEVWVDGRYVADARELDGDPSYLWLKQGAHHVVVYKAGYKSFDSEVDVRPGILRSLKLQLEKGDSQPPTPAPAPEARAEAAPSSEPRGDVVLRIEPRDATVYVDGRNLGIARELAVLQLPAGHHRIELARPGYREATKEIDVEAGGRSELALSMERGGGFKY